MTHLATTKCECGHEFTASDIRPPLRRVPVGFFGSNVDRESDTKCPGCEKEYTLLIKQTGQTWRVRSIALRGEEAAKTEQTDDSEKDEFDAMEKPELVAFLKENEIEYTPNWGEKRLRETARAWKAAQQPKTEDGQ